MTFDVFLELAEKYGHPEDARAIGALLDERDRYQTALEDIASDEHAWHTCSHSDAAREALRG